MRLEGRAEELELIAALTSRLEDHGLAVVLVGDPGVGKTALLEAAQKQARLSGLLVLQAHAAEFEAEIPYSGLSQLTAPLLDVIPELGRAHEQALEVSLGLREGPAPSLAAVATAILALLRRVSQAQPVLLTVDDLHWCDRLSAAALSFVARRVSSAPLGLLVAVRTGSSTAFERAGLTEVELRPLDQGAAERLTRSRFPQLSTDEVARVVDESRGNPLALLELPQGMSGQMQFAEVPFLPTSASVSQRVQRLFASRVEALPGRARQLLLLSALSGQGELALLQKAAQGDALADLAFAERAGLLAVEDSTHRVRFRHPLAGAAVVGLSTAEERYAAHRALADAVDGDVVRRALHLAEATVDPDEVVAQALDRAARHCLARGDTHGAAQALIRAAQLSPLPQDRSRRLSEAAYVGADVAGDLQGALALLTEARAGAVDLPQSLAAALAASYVLLNGDCDVDAAHSLLVGGLDAHGGDPEAAEGLLTAALQSLLMVCWTGGRDELWSDFFAALSGADAKRLNQAEPDPLALCVGTFVDPVHAAAPLLAPLEQAAARLKDESDPVRITTLGLASVYVDRVAACRSALWRVVEDGRSGGAVALAINALTTLSVDDWHAGHWDRVQQQTAEGVQMSEQHGYRRYSWILGSYLSTLVTTVRGDVERGRWAADELSDWARAKGAGIAEVFATHLRCLAAQAAGDMAEAYSQACRISPAGILPPRVPHALWVPLDLVEAGVRAGHLTQARAHVRCLEEQGVANLSSRLKLVVGTAAALIAEEGEYADHFEEALAGEAAANWRFDHARARLLYGERLRRSRSPRQSREHLTAACSTFADLGAAPWLARAEQELRATGQKHMSTRTAPPDALTPQELRIALLAAEGRSNKEIGQQLHLSPRTVGAHLYRIFPRLGITSRAALRDALSSRGHQPHQPGR